MKNVLPVNKTYRLSAAVLSMALLFSACSAPTAPETESPAQSNYVAEAHKKVTTGILRRTRGKPVAISRRRSCRKKSCSIRDSRWRTGISG